MPSSTRHGPVGGRAARPRLRRGPGRRGVRGDPRCPAQRDAATGSSGRSPRLRELGLPIDEQLAELDLRDDDALGRPTVARALVAAGHATSVEDAFQRLVGRGCPAYVPRSGLGPVEAIEAIRAAGGLAALAHFREAPSHRDLLRELIDAGLAGLEVHYRSFNRPTTEAMAQVATEEGLLADRWLRLSRRHGDLRRIAREAVGAAEVGAGAHRCARHRPGASRAWRPSC